MRNFLKLDFFNLSYREYIKYIVVIALVMFFIRVQYSLGWLAGNLFYFLNLILKNEYVDYILTMKSFNKFLFSLYYLVSLILLVGSFLLGFIFPQVLSPYTAFIGVLGFKLFLYLGQFRGGERVEN